MLQLSSVLQMSRLIAWLVIIMQAFGRQEASTDRNRNIIRRDAELADQKLRSSFVSMAANKTQRGSEFVNEAMQTKIMSGKTESRKETRQIFKVPNNR